MDQARDGASKAVVEIDRFRLSDSDKSPEAPAELKRLKRRIRAIADRYWSEKAFEQRNIIADLKRGAKRLEQPLRKVADIMDQTDGMVKHYLNRLYRVQASEELKDVDGQFAVIGTPTSCCSMR